jgi:hypothetical protein
MDLFISPKIISFVDNYIYFLFSLSYNTKICTSCIHSVKFLPLMHLIYHLIVNVFFIFLLSSSLQIIPLFLFAFPYFSPQMTSAKPPLRGGGGGTDMHTTI